MSILLQQKEKIERIRIICMFHFNKTYRENANNVLYCYIREY